MRIFVAGATGAIGKPLVFRLLAEGHEVFALTRSKERSAHLLDIGAKPIVADVLNAASLMHALKEVEPEVIVDMLTSLPKEYTPQSMKEASVQDQKVRLDGGSNLQAAARAVRSRRYISQSSAFWYAPGSGLADENTPFAITASPGIAAGAKVYAQIEQRILQSPLDGVALRFGFFYGPGTWYATDGSMAKRVLNRDYPIVGGGRGVWNFIHIEDAADAIAMAIHGPTGIYNIVNDTPLEVSSWLPAYANWLGAPSPLERTIEEELFLNSADSVYYATQLRGASNANAKQDLSFTPRPLEWLII